MPGGWVLGVLLLLEVDGKRVDAVFGRKDREVVEEFARRVSECAAKVPVAARAAPAPDTAGKPAG
jgi:hypothetical protein